jgi:hypothetical protein
MTVSLEISGSLYMVLSRIVVMRKPEIVKKTGTPYHM